jgi:hypothetical protein
MALGGGRVFVIAGQSMPTRPFPAAISFAES